MELAPWLAALKLDDWPGLLASREADVVSRSPRREILRFSLPAGAGPLCRLLLKREFTARRKTLLTNLLAGRGWTTRARNEWHIASALRQAGIICPRPLTLLERGLWPRQTCLLMEEVPGAESLGAFLAAQTFGSDDPARQMFFTLLGEQVARLHATGCDHPRLYATHVLVIGSESERQIGFCEFERSRIARRVSPTVRGRDLAALWATLPRRLADERDRKFFFDGYFAQAECEDQAAEILAATERHRLSLLKQRRIWEIRESDTELHRSVRRLESDASETMWIDRRFRPYLERGQIATFAAMMATIDGQCLRALEDRENWRIELSDGQQPPLGAYLKKHHVRTRASRWRARLGRGPGQSAGLVEARNVARLSRGGIAAMQLIAFGERLHADGLLESFVLTEELTGYTQLDHFLRQRFSELPSQHSTRRDRHLMRLICEVADVARHFHALGYNHRDLYCCHFFIREPQTGTFQVNLIDLQRVEHRRYRRRRWIVKDLSQLAYSAPRERISCRHKLAFMKRYLGVRKLRSEDKRLIRRVLLKQRWMERTLGLHP